MAPLVADGIYKILNVQYPRSAVDLIYANPNGAIAGYTDNDNTKNQQVQFKFLSRPAWSLICSVVEAEERW